MLMDLPSQDHLFNLKASHPLEDLAMAQHCRFQIERDHIPNRNQVNIREQNRGQYKIGEERQEDHHRTQSPKVDHGLKGGEGQG